MKGAELLAHPSSLSPLSRQIFSPDEIAWLTFKGNFASRRDNILVGVRGGRKRVEKQEWDLWTEMSGDRWEPGRSLSPTCRCEAGAARVGWGQE